MSATLGQPIGPCALLSVPWSAGRPQLRVRFDGAPESVLIDPIGVVLNYRVPTDPRRWCVGHRAQTSGYVDCPTPLTEPGRTCSRCSAAEAIFASQLHHAHTQPRRSIDSDIGRHLAQENVLYLAGFRDGSIKVGTSTATRRDTRWLEQGAWIVHQVAISVDGYAVREAEDLVTRELGVVQAVPPGRKVRGLGAPVSDESLTADLEAIERRVLGLLDQLADRRLSVDHDRWTNPAASRPVWGETREYPLRPHRGSHDLQIVDVVGRCAAVERRRADTAATTDRFVIDLGRLLGVEVEFGAYASDEIVIQDSLF